MPHTSTRTYENFVVRCYLTVPELTVNFYDKVSCMTVASPNPVPLELLQSKVQGNMLKS